MSNHDEAFAAELHASIGVVRLLATSEEIRGYLNRLDQTNFLAPPNPELEANDLDEDLEERWPSRQHALGTRNNVSHCAHCCRLNAMPPFAMPSAPLVDVLNDEPQTDEKRGLLDCVIGLS